MTKRYDAHPVGRALAPGTSIAAAALVVEVRTVQPWTPPARGRTRWGGRPTAVACAGESHDNSWRRERSPTSERGIDRASRVLDAGAGTRCHVCVGWPGVVPVPGGVRGVGVVVV